MPCERTPSLWWPRGRLRLAAALLVLGGIGPQGCDDTGANTERLLARAEQRLAAGDAAAAEIDLRAVLQRNPEAAGARLLLGRALAARGLWGAAEAEFQRAGDLGATADVTAVAWSELQLAMGRPAAVLDRYRQRTLGQGAPSADLLTQVALAQRELGDLGAADTLLEQALAQSPGHVGALLARARGQAARGDLASARGLAQSLTSEKPELAGPWVLLGDLLPEPAAATVAYRRALSLEPRLLQAHAGLIRASLRAGDRTAFAEQVSALRRALPGDPTGLYYEALLAEQQGDLRRARERLQPLLGAGSADPELLLLAGVVERRLGGFEQAELALARAVQARPRAAEPRIEWARLHVQTARPERALAALAPLLGATGTQAEAFSLAAQAHTLAGNYAAADAAFGRAARLSPQDPRLRAAAGRALLLRGEIEKGLAMLKASAAADGEGAGIDLQLVAFHMQRRDVAQALAAAATLATKPRQRPLAAHVRGRILQSGGDVEGARAAYGQAVAAEPRFLAAISSLAQLDADQGQLEAARGHYDAYLKLEPRSTQALLAMAVLSRRGGATREQAARWLDRAVAANPNDAATWRSVIEFHRNDQDPNAALARARAAAAALPDDADLKAELAAAQLATGDTQQALSNLSRAAQIRPGSAEIQLRLAEAQLHAGHTGRGAEAVQRALGLAPEWPPALRSITALDLSQGRHEEALARVRALQKRQPAQPLGWQLESEIEAAREAWPKARAAMRKALERDPASTALAVQQHLLLRASGDKTAAAQWQDGWLGKHPRDAAFMLHLAQLAEGDGDDRAAAHHYGRALELRKGDAAVMNNLALVLTRLKDSGALPLAQQAARLAPYSPQVLDTLALAHAQQGDAEQAIASQRKAVELVPHELDYRWRLAQLYLRARQPDKARAELQRIQASGRPFADREQAEQLLKQLGG